MVMGGLRFETIRGVILPASSGLLPAPALPLAEAIKVNLLLLPTSAAGTFFA